MHINGQAHKLISRANAIEKQSLFASVAVKEDDGFVMEIKISEVIPLSPLIEQVGIYAG